MYLSMAVPITAPPCSRKNSGKSVPPPKKLTRNGVWTIITDVLRTACGHWPSEAQGECRLRRPDSSPLVRGHSLAPCLRSVSYTHLRAHETPEHLVCRLLL